MSLSLPALDEHCTKTADFRNIFDNTSRPIFYDDVHVVDKGNEIIAREIFSLITPLLDNHNDNSWEIYLRQI